MKRLTILKLMVGALLLVGCSEDDSETSQDVILDGGIISRYQFVKIEMEHQIEQDTYDGMIGGNTLTLVRRGENSIGFMVNEDLPLGETTLSIPQFDMQVNYTIEDVELSQSVDQTISNLITGFTNLQNNFPFGESIEDQAAITAIEDFTTGISQLEEAEREKFAKFYKANETLITDMLNTDYIAPVENARFNQNNYLDSLIGGMSENQLSIAMIGSVFALGKSAWLGYACIKTGQYWGAAGFAAIAGVAYITTKKLAEEVVSRKMKKTNLSINGLESELNERAFNDIVSFTSHEDTSIYLQIASRTLNPEDGDDTNNLVSSFFNAFDQFNILIDKINETITFINEYTPLEMTPKQNVGPEDSESIYDNVDAITYEDLTFSVGSTDVSIASAVFEEGELLLNLVLNEDIDLQEDEYLETYLNYTYTNDLNGFSGRFPIAVYDSQTIVGTWNMVVFNNDVSVGDYDYGYDEDCPNIAIQKETDSGYYTFNSDNTFSYYWENETIWYSVVINQDCEVSDDNANEVYDESQTGTGTYTFNGTNYILNYDDGGMETLYLLEPNRIKIYEEEYVRE